MPQITQLRIILAKIEHKAMEALSQDRELDVSGLFLATMSDVEITPLKGR